MKTSEKTAALILIFAFFLGLLVTGGCVSPHRAESNRVSYQFQSRIPDVWAEKPKQEISVKMEFRR